MILLGASNATAKTVTVFSEDFEGGALPTGWTADSKGGGETSGASQIQGSDAHGGSKCWKLGTNSNPYGSVTTCGLNFTGDATLKVWARGKSAKSPKLILSATGCTISPTTEVTINGNTYTEYTYTLTDVTKAATITFKHNGPSDAGSYIYIDDITITQEQSDALIATTTTIDDSGLTNTDLYVGTAAGKLVANVTETTGGAAVAGATVSWSSSNTAIATIDEEGNVTLKKKGSTTITADFAVTATHASSSNTYVLTVTDSDPTKPLFYESVSGYTGDSDSSSKLTPDNTTYLDSDMWDSFTDVYPGRNGCFKFGTSSKAGTAVTKAIPLTGNGILTFKIKKYSDTEVGPLNITVTGATATGATSATATGDFVTHVVYINGGTGSVVITFATASKRLFVDDIALYKVSYGVTTIPTVISAAGYATFSAPYAVDFTGTGVTAYIAKEKDASNVTLTEIAKVPASTGIVVNAPAGTYAIPVLAGEADATTGNLLKPWLTAGTPTDGTYYTLAAGPTFKKSSGGTLAAGKAYLVMAGAGAPELGVDFGGTTGIDNVQSSKVNVQSYYNLAGQRVGNPTKGLYIVNGKKVIIK